MTWSKDPNRRRGVPQAQRTRILTQHNNICHICGHGAAEQIDHITNVATWTREGRAGSPHRDSNLAPAHQAPCPTCDQRCHATKTQTEAHTARTPRNRPTEHHPGLLPPQGEPPPTPTHSQARSL
jgi:hypothetical protein